MIRHMFGFQRDALTGDAIGQNSTRSSADLITNYLNAAGHTVPRFETYRLGFETYRLGFETYRLGFETYRLGFETYRLGFETSQLGFETSRLGF